MNCIKTEELLIHNDNVIIDQTVNDILNDYKQESWNSDVKC